jgi:hypothetical protein
MKLAVIGRGGQSTRSHIEDQALFTRAAADSRIVAVTNGWDFAAAPIGVAGLAVRAVVARAADGARRADATPCPVGRARLTAPALAIGRAFAGFGREEGLWLQQKTARGHHRGRCAGDGDGDGAGEGGGAPLEHGHRFSTARATATTTTRSPPEATLAFVVVADHDSGVVLGGM